VCLWHTEQDCGSLAVLSPFIVHLLADVLCAGLRCHLQLHGSVAHSSHDDITENCCAHTKPSQSASRIATLLVVEIDFPTEKLSALFTRWLSRLKSEAVLATCHSRPLNQACESTFPCLSQLADSPEEEYHRNAFI
jgi:hypothetical protein